MSRCFSSSKVNLWCTFGAMPAPLRPLTNVVGDNCKRLRLRIGVTQDELARFARYVGLRWQASSVGNFEAGRAAPTLATVIALAAALQWALEDSALRAGQSPTWAVTMSDLVAGGLGVSVTETLVVESETLTQWLSGGPVHIPHDNIFGGKGVTQADSLVADVEELVLRSGLAEARVAKQLGVDSEVLALASSELWGRTFTEERDHRAGAGVTKQKRGQVTREMRAELATAIDNMRGQN